MSLLMDSLNFEDRSEKIKQQLPKLLERITGSENWQPILRSMFAANNFQIYHNDDRQVMTYFWQKEPTLREWNNFCSDFKGLLSSGMFSQEIMIFMPKGSRHSSREEAFGHMLEGRAINYVDYEWDIRKKEIELAVDSEPITGDRWSGEPLSSGSRPRETTSLMGEKDDIYPFYRVSQLTREELSDILDISFELNFR